MEDMINHTTQESEDLFPNLLDNDHLKQAIIVSEILTRKY